MSWREREFSHESEAYHRSLDQAWSGANCTGDASMGYHCEDGKNVLDWFTVTNRGRKVRIDFGYNDSEAVVVIIEGGHHYKVLFSDQLGLIRTARELALKLLKEEDERSRGTDHSDRGNRALDSGSDLPTTNLK